MIRGFKFYDNEEVVMSKWTIKYVIIEEDSKISKETDVYGSNVFEAYFNANKLLSILERGKKIHKIEVVH